MKEVATAYFVSTIGRPFPRQYLLGIVNLNNVETAFNSPFDRCNPLFLQIFNTVLGQRFGLW